ncbi:MAG TPA: secretin N-terminal domain-containing protein [Pyrinomonadaceae bacterium]|jgi:hypothetical protein
MFSIKQIKLAVIVLCLAFSSTALGQQTTPTPQPAQSSVESKIGLKNRVFEIKYRDPESLIAVIKLLGSGVGGMAVSSEYNTITVRDYAENLATIEEAIKRLDTPSPPAPGIEFHIHILIATAIAPSSSNPFPSELNDVVKQLQNTLSYKNYYVMTSAVLRTKEGPTGVENKGVADFKLVTEGAARNSPIIYSYSARQVKIEGTPSNASAIQIGRFSFDMRIPIETSPGVINYEGVGFNTPVNMREGEKVVVGTTTMQEKGVIVVLSARIIK